MANVDVAFRKVNPRGAGFYIWRIEDMKVIAVPEKGYSKFYTGDSYIVLSVRETKGALDAHIHFWLGNETSQDEAGVAAYKSVELDDCMGGAPVQHREVQGCESKLFSSYFPKGVTYLEGGVKSGLNHVTHTFKKRLLQVKGKNHVRVSEVPMEWSSFNSGDTFILDLGNVIFVWNGKDCSYKEKMKGLEQAKNLRDERASHHVSLIIMAEGNEGSLKADEEKVFSKYLPLSEKTIKGKDEGGSDDVADRNNSGNIKLYRCAEDNGTLKVTEVKEGPLRKSDLDSNDSFIIDNGAAGIWAWIGKNSTKNEKSQAMRNALGFIKKKGLPDSTQVTRVVEGGERSDFQCLFKSWPMPPVSGKAYSQNKIARTVQTKFDAATLHSNQQLAAQTQMVDDGSGKTEIWRVNNFDLEPMQKKHMGQFFGGDCYVIQYTYEVNNKENYIVYFWQGLKSSADEKGTSALKAVEIDDKLGGAAVQVRVVQNKEPQHFMAMFDGKMIIFSGGRAGWDGGSDTEGPGDSYMLQVRGTSVLNTKAVQVAMSAESLNSNDTFVIITKSNVFIWCGKGSTGDEREAAKLVSKRSPREPQIVVEGQEKQNFWAAIGGQKEYASDKRLQEEECIHPPRLFQLSNASGRFTVDELPEFCQTDCAEDDAMILDCWDGIYIWIGAGAREEEKKESQRLAVEYIQTDPAGRDVDTPIYIVKQGFEPPSFTGFFGAWDRELWSNGQSYEELSQQLSANNEPIMLEQETLNGTSETNFDETPKYPVAELQVPADELPSGVDPLNREMFMLESDFTQMFKMDYKTFMAKPNWKQQEMKKKNKLF